MKILVALVFLLIMLSHTVNAQEGSFKVLRFTVDNKEIKDYSVIFEVEGNELKLIRHDNEFFIPKEITEDEKVAIKFQTKGYNFKFENFTGFNATDNTRVKMDYIVGVDTAPFEKENTYKRKARKFRAIYFLQTVPTVPLNSKLIVDPIRFTVGELRRKK